MRGHLKTHSGEKSNKCGQCDSASSEADSLGAHLETHRGGKSNKCNQCHYASFQAGDLNKHFKGTVKKSKENSTNATMHPLNKHLRTHSGEMSSKYSQRLK